MSDKICVKAEDHPQDGDHFQGEAELHPRTYPCCGRSDGHAKSCISTARMLAGEPATFTPVTRHVSAIDEDEFIDRFRWRCSCGKSGRWVSRRWQAVQGAATHARRNG